MTTRINGGIITDQMLSGSFRYFVMTGGDFAHTVGQGTIAAPTTIIPGQSLLINTYSPTPTPTISENVIVDKFVGAGQPVPNSIADRVFKVITERCTVLLISLINSSEIHFIVEGGSCGWNDVSEMMLALATSGISGTDGIVGTKVPGDPAIPDATPTGRASFDLANIIIEEKIKPKFTVGV